MAITNGYATLAEIKTYLSTAATIDDVRLEKAIEAASRSIDANCRRVFYATSTVRYFEANDPHMAFLPDDLLSVTELAIDSGNRVYQALSATDYELEPDIAPYQSVYASELGNRSFPTFRRGLKLTGSWGFCATGQHPQAVNAACLILATRYFKRRDAAFGVIGTPELGFTRIQSKDPEVKALLMPFVRMGLDGC